MHYASKEMRTHCDSQYYMAVGALCTDNASPGLMQPTTILLSIVRDLSLSIKKNEVHEFDMLV